MFEKKKNVPITFFLLIAKVDRGLIEGKNYNILTWTLVLAYLSGAVVSLAITSTMNLS